MSLNLYKYKSTAVCKLQVATIGGTNKENNFTKIAEFYTAIFDSRPAGKQQRPTANGEQTVRNWQLALFKSYAVLSSIMIFSHFRDRPDCYPQKYLGQNIQKSVLRSLYSYCLMSIWYLLITVEYSDL